MVISPFSFSRIPVTHFGTGKFGILGGIVRNVVGQKRALIITGASSFQSSPNWDLLSRDFAKSGVDFVHYRITGEPSPDFVDSTVRSCKDGNIGAVIAIGGGSAVDAGKAVSAMLLQESSVTDYLEGVGTGKVHNGTKVPFIAVPTTAGTGSEATKNAVLSKIGEQGFKKSLRHENFIPDVAVIDPLLTLSCPRSVTISCGMDAFTQLLESYVSPGASPMTDSLAVSGLCSLSESLISVCTEGSNDTDKRSGMSYAAFLSGITLANAGLGVVHGLASEIGGHFDIPHGVICATLVGAATRINIEKLKKRGEQGKGSLEKYARAGAIVSGRTGGDVAGNADALVETIDQWVEMLKVPRLRQYGFEERFIDKIVEATSVKNNSVPLEADEIHSVLSNRI